MLRIGALIDEKYKILQYLGQGRWGRVYLAENIKLGNYWAIKEIGKLEEGPVNLLAEPDILKKLNHPSLPRIVDFINTGDFLYIVEDYFEGRNLRDLLHQRQLFSEETVVDWGVQLCEILIYLHGLKPHPIIYRDMKPGNIIIDHYNKVKLVDFGIARVYSGQENDSTFIGTIGYAAPEQYSLGKRCDERTDIYSLGVTLFHLLTGVNPREFPQGLPQVREVNRDVSPGLEKIVNKCLQPDPDARYQNARELMEALKKSVNVRHEKPGGLLDRFKDLLNGKNPKVVFIEKLIGTAIVAVGGTNRGAGCTHTAISLAAFLNRQNLRTAVVEINENPAFANLATLKDGCAPAAGCFRVSGIDFFYQNAYNKGNNLMEAVQAGYDFVIIDSGTLISEDSEAALENDPSGLKKNKWFNDSLRAHINILVSGSAVWQIHHLIRHLRHEFFDTWKVVLAIPEQQNFDGLCRQLGRKLFFSRFSPDPFEVNAHQEALFAEILGTLFPRENLNGKKLFFRMK